MKTILGAGQLGLVLLDILLNRYPDEPLQLVNRTGKVDMTLPPRVNVLAADVTDPEAMEKIARGSEVMFSCTDVPYPAWATFYPAAASALAHALRVTDVRLVFADNLYSYGNVAGAEMHEGLPHVAKTKKGRIRASVIDVLLNSDKRIAERVAFIKAADFIGPGIYKGVFGRDFLSRLHSGRSIMLFGNASLAHTFTYIRDFANAMANVGHAPDAFGQIWHVPNAPALSLKEWLRLFENESGKKARAVPIPGTVVWLAGLLNPLVMEFRELSYQFQYPYLVSHTKYVSRFGNHSTSPVSIVSDTVRWYEKTKER